MSATVFGTSKFGLESEVTATGIFAANVSFSGTSETAVAPNHIGQDVAMSVFNESIDVSIDGALAVKGAGFEVGIADVVALANINADSLDIPANLLKVTPIEGASTIITGATLTRTNNGFESGSLTGVFKPGIDAGTFSSIS